MIKNNKEKVFELKIQEDDEVSGIDSISLVDSPAIEVNWVAFKKETEHTFEKDELYVQHLMTRGEKEEDLLNDGWVVNKVDVLDKNSFISTDTDPNAPSFEDEQEYKVRYKYILNPLASGPAIIPTSRHFCKQVIAQNRVWRVEDIDAAINDFDESPLVYRGSFNCRHVWSRIEYKRDATIINKASVNKGKVEVGGFPSGMEPDPRVMGYPEPDTRTSNPSFNKEKFDGKPKVSLDYDGVLSTPQGEELYKELVDAGNDVYIVTARNEAEGTDVLNKAKALRLPQDKVLFTNGQPKSDVLKRIGITKHYDNNIDVINEIKKNAPDVEAIKFGYDVGGLPSYVDQVPKKKKSSYLEEFEYLLPKKDMSKQHFATDSEKHIVLGPAMVPDQKIFRKDAEGNPYYVYFTSETIKMIAEKYMKNKYTDNNDQMHDGKAIKDIYVVESWIKEDGQDKSSKYGFSDLPIGTWFVSMKVNNPQIWSKVKNGELNGFSVSGFFEEVAKFSREEMFLYKVAEILQKIDEKN